jgi:hypothetical protein
MINATGDSQNFAEIKTQIPDITDHFLEVITCILMTPKKGDPRDDERFMLEATNALEAAGESWREVYDHQVEGTKSTGKVRRVRPCQWGVPSIIWGLSGIGKSERIEEVAEGLNLPFAELFPSQHTPEDFSGTKMPDGAGRMVTVCTLPGIEELRNAGDGVIFLDEASGAVPATQAAMLEFVNRGRVGDIRLPLGVRRILAANPPEYAASGSALESPMANRLAHFKVNPPGNESWAHHILYEELAPKIDLTLCKMRLLQGWTNAWSQTVSEGANFVRTRDPRVLHAQPLPSSPLSGYAWPSQRSWVLGLRGMATARALSMPDIIGEMMFEACVGRGVATEFLSWQRNADLPSPETVLNEGWKVNTDRLDITTAVIDSVASYTIGIRDMRERAEVGTRAWQFLGQVVKAQMPDLVVNASKLLLRNGLGRESKHATADLRKSLEPVLTALQHGRLLNYLS